MYNYNELTLTEVNGTTTGKLSVKLTWDAVQDTRGFFEMLKEPPPNEYDLDLSAVLCGEDGSAKAVVYYGARSYGIGIVLSDDNRYGCVQGRQSGSCEEIVINLEQVPQDINMIDIVVNMHNAVEYKQHFPEVRNASVVLTRDNGYADTVLFSRSLSDGIYEQKHGMVFCRLARNGGAWKEPEERYETFGDDDGRDLQAIVDRY